MYNSDKSIHFMRYQELCTLREKYKELYKALEIRFTQCACFQCRMRVVTLGMAIVRLNSKIASMEQELLPSIETILQSMDIIYTVEEGQVKLAGK